MVSRPSCLRRAVTGACLGTRLNENRGAVNHMPHKTVFNKNRVGSLISYLQSSIYSQSKLPSSRNIA